MSKYLRKAIIVEAFQMNYEDSLLNYPKWFRDSIGESIWFDSAMSQYIVENTVPILDGDYVVFSKGYIGVYSKEEFEKEFINVDDVGSYEVVIN